MTKPDFSFNQILFLYLMDGVTVKLTQGDNAYWALPTPGHGISREEMAGLLNKGWVRRTKIGEITLSNEGHVMLEQHREILEKMMPDQTMERAFERAMEGRQYGPEETQDAKAWFKAGWKAAHKDNTNTYLILYDDADRNPTVISNAPWHVAKYTYEQKSLQWNAHLFVKIDSNTKDAYPKGDI